MSLLFIIALLYTSIGILLNIIGPAAEKLNPEFRKVSKPDILEYAQNPKLQKRWLVYSAIAGIRLLVIVAWLPVALIVLFEFIIHPERYSKRIKRLKMRRKIKKEGLYFYQTFGKGLFTCNNCGYSQELISHIHGFGENPWYKTGYQCEACGAFQVIEGRFKETERLHICECGGKLSRKNPIVCPECRSKDVNFQAKFIT